QMFEELLLIRYPKGLLRELFRIKPDVIVGLEARIDCIVGATWARLTGRGYITWSDLTVYFDMCMGSIRRSNRRMMLAFSHAAIGSCTDSLTYFNQIFNYPKESAFLSSLNGYIDDRIADAIEFDPDNTDCSDDDRVRFVFVGRLIELKGLDLLLQAFARLLEHAPKALLTIIGNGPEQDALEALSDELGCRNSVIFQGSVPYERVLNEMSLHDVFVLPTRLDVFGLVVSEAIACGLPVICSHYAGAANDLVQENGIIVDPENLDELTGAMEKLACNPQLRTQMAAAGKTVLQQYDLQSAVNGFTGAIHLACRKTGRTTDL
ncbi:MAG: glycosyltransferase family 1 protein, partial [Candidatus Electrothrix sp. AR5]|nr:glycosyltransferase family 1 protein [Candidatus Electrothrix sp. AR5]